MFIWIKFKVKSKLINSLIYIGLYIPLLVYRRVQNLVQIFQLSNYSKIQNLIKSLHRRIIQIHTSNSIYIKITTVSRIRLILNFREYKRRGKSWKFKNFSLIHTKSDPSKSGILKMNHSNISLSLIQISRIVKSSKACPNPRNRALYWKKPFPPSVSYYRSNNHRTIAIPHRNFCSTEIFILRPRATRQLKSRAGIELVERFEDSYS